MIPTSAALALVTAVACGDSTTGVQPADLAGTWAITSLEFDEIGGTGSVDFIADLGAIGTITIESDGSFEFSVTLAGSTDTDPGILTVDGSDVTLDFGDNTSQGTISRDGDVVTIEIETGAEFDFDDDGSDDPATARIVMEKQ
jgi:hypothetical protein